MARRERELALQRLRGVTAWLALGGLLLAGCSKKSGDDDEKKAEAPAPVQVTSVVQDNIQRLVEADGVLYPQDQASIVPKISAPVQRFLVNRGDHVKAGQLLAVLDNRDLSAAVAESRGLLNQAESSLQMTSQATLPEEMVKAQSDVQAGAQLETAKEHLRTLQGVGKDEQVKGARAQVEAARAHLQSAEAQVAYSEIRSPISGVIADRPLYAGEMAGAGTPLLTVMDISRVVARVNVPQAQATAVKVGQPATVTQTDNGEKLEGKVTVVSPATDPNSTTVQVWITAANPGEKFKPGAAVHAAILTETIKNASIVPASAILPGEEGGTAVLTVSADSTAHLRPVEVGVRYGDKVQILSGVRPGDEVVTAGGLGVDDKAKVRIVGAAEEKADDDDDTPAPPDAKDGAPKK